jgi:hypothetical protein
MSEYNPFDWRDGTPSIFAPKERSPEAIQKANAAAKLAARRVNKESHIAFSSRDADDRTNAIRNSTP